MTPYYTPKGGLPPQSAIHTGRAVFTEAYAVIPKGVFSDIVTSSLPGWSKTRLMLGQQCCESRQSGFNLFNF